MRIMLRRYSGKAQRNSPRPGEPEGRRPGCGSANGFANETVRDGRDAAGDSRRLPSSCPARRDTLARRRRVRRMSCEVRAAIADHELDVRKPLAEAEGQVTGPLHGLLAGGVRGDAAKMHPAGAVLDEHQHIQSFSSTVSTCRKAGRDDPGGLGMKKLTPRRTRPARRRIGPAPGRRALPGPGC